MTHEDVKQWLDRYVVAWESYDPVAIGDLFSESAEYRFHPADEPVVGRGAIVAAWVTPEGAASSRDEPGTYAASYGPFAVDGRRAVAVGWSRYWEDATRRVERAVYDCETHSCSSSMRRVDAARSRSSTASVPDRGDRHAPAVGTATSAIQRDGLPGATSGPAAGSTIGR